MFRAGTTYLGVMASEPLRRAGNLPGGKQFAERSARSAHAPISGVRGADQSTAADRKEGASFLQRLLEDEVAASRLLASRYFDELRTQPGAATEVIRLLNRFSLILCLLSLARLDRAGIEALRSSGRVSPDGPSKRWLKVLTKLHGHLRQSPLIVLADNLFDDDDETLRWFFAESGAVRAMNIVFALLTEEPADAWGWSAILLNAEERSANAIRSAVRRGSRASNGAGITLSAILVVARRSLAAAVREVAAVREEVSEALTADEIGDTNDGYRPAEARADLLKLTERLHAVSRPTDLGVKLLRQAAALDDPSTANLIRLVQVSVRPGIGEAAAKKFVQRTFERVRQLVDRQNKHPLRATDRVAIERQHTAQRNSPNSGVVGSESTGLNTKRRCPDRLLNPTMMQVRG